MPFYTKYQMLHTLLDVSALETIRHLYFAHWEYGKGWPLKYETYNTGSTIGSRMRESIMPPETHVLSNLNALKVTMRVAPVSAAIAIHREAKPSRVNVMNKNFNPREKAIFSFIIRNVSRDL